jgi:hypothetical protein
VQDGRALKIVLEGQEKRVVLRELLQGALRLVVEILVRKLFIRPSRDIAAMRRKIRFASSS